MKFYRRFRLAFGIVPLTIAIFGAMAMVDRGGAHPEAPGWDPKAAASYLDDRATFWATWPNAARDRGTFWPISIALRNAAA